MPLKQTAFLKEKLFTLNCQGEFRVNDNDETKLEGCESFVVLYSGHFLIQKSHGAPVILERRTYWGNWNSWITADPRRFAIYKLSHTAAFWLPTLFPKWSGAKSISFYRAVRSWALWILLAGLERWSCTKWLWEYVLLKCINNKELLERLEKAHQMNPRVLSLALVSLTRKIEVTEASHRLFALSRHFHAPFITKKTFH